MASSLDTLARQALVSDDTAGTSLQLRRRPADDCGGTSLEGCHDDLIPVGPGVIHDNQRSYRAAGAQTLETRTFQQTPYRLAEWSQRAAVTA